MGMNWAGQKVLVTGGAGFVPSHVTDLLVERGADVTVIDNLQAGKTENLVDAGKRVTFLEQDIRHTDAVRNAGRAALTCFTCRQCICARFREGPA